MSTWKKPSTSTEINIFIMIYHQVKNWISFKIFSMVRPFDVLAKKSMERRKFSVCTETFYRSVLVSVHLQQSNVLIFFQIPIGLSYLYSTAVLHIIDKESLFSVAFFLDKTEIVCKAFALHTISVSIFEVWFIM